MHKPETNSVNMTQQQLPKLYYLNVERKDVGLNPRQREFVVSRTVRSMSRESLQLILQSPDALQVICLPRLAPICDWLCRSHLLFVTFLILAGDAHIALGAGFGSRDCRAASPFAVLPGR
jgi:hypothetical protein